ncbi:MAG: MFS transporter [Ignavibacteria bacterium]|nr:MFS transporter [Ignavibacteria bacterium]
MTIPTKTKNTVLFVSVITAFLTAFLGSSVNVALPSIEKEFKIDAVTIAWISTSYLLATASLLLPFGRLSDILGRKKTFVAGLFFYTIFSFLSVFAANEIWLIILRALQGVGSSMIFATSTAIIISVFPFGERGKAMGYSVTAVYLGLSLGPLIGGFLTQALGWRSIFYLNVPFGIFAIILVSLRLKTEWADSKGEKFDLTGSIIYSLALLLLMLGLTNIQTLNAKFAVLLGFFLLLLFVLYERKANYPILNLELFSQNPVFSFSNISALIIYSSTLSVSFLLSLYLQYIKGLDPKQAGFILSIQPIVQASLSSFAGKLSDRIEARIVASFGMLLCSIGLFFLSFINFHTPLYYIFISQTILGIGFAFFSSPNTNAIMNSVDKKFYGVASAMGGTMRLVGQTLGLGFTTMFFSIYLGHNEITPKIYPTFVSIVQHLLIGYALLCFSGIFASLVKGSVNQKSI